MRKQILSGGIWALSGKILMLLSGLAINSLLARILSSNDLGIYFITISLVSVASNFAQFGLTRTVVRLVAENIGIGRFGNAARSVRLSLHITAVSVSIVSCLMLFGGGHWISIQVFHSQEMEKIIGLAVLWIVILTFQNLLAEIFRGFNDIHHATFFGGLSASLLLLMMLAIFWFFGRSAVLYKIVLLALVSSACGVLLAFFFLAKRLGRLPDAVGEISVREILTISYPLWITTIVVFALTQSDIWIIGAFLSRQEVAIYGAAARVIALVTLPLLIVNLVTPPIIADLFSQNKILKLERVLRTTASISMPFALMMVIVFFFWGGGILSLIFGPFYRDGALILLILSFGQAVNVGAGSCGMVLMLTGHQKTMMAITIVVGISTLLASLLMVEKYGIVGVAIATSLGMALQNVSMVLFVKIKTGMWTHAYLMPPRNAF